MMSLGKYEYGWIPMGMHPSTEYSSKVVLRGYDVPTAFEKMGWKSFTSDQL